jgi:hypothetical protein
VIAPLARERVIEVASRVQKLATDLMLEQKVARECMSSFIRQRVAGRSSGLWARLVNKFSSDKKVLADSGLFDADWYLQNYPDVAEARHYLTLGASEGRDPNPFFSTKAYMKFNLDIARSGMNPLVHFVRYGAAKGRRFSE